MFYFTLGSASCVEQYIFTFTAITILKKSRTNIIVAVCNPGLRQYFQVRLCTIKASAKKRMLGGGGGERVLGEEARKEGRKRNGEY